MPSSNVIDHPVVSNQQWLDARKQLLARERELTHLHDQIARERRALPWQAIDKDYVFETPQGRRTLAQLFEGRRQLLVQHFMLGPGWEAGCPSCSFMADHVDGMNVHLAQRDVTYVAVSRAPLAEIERFRRRMGWQFNWVSSFGTDFNFDFQVSFTPDEKSRNEVVYNYAPGPFRSEELPGISVFIQDDAGRVLHTYSTYGRGVEAMMGAYVLMDLTPKGRDEDDLSFPMAWIRHHDRYEATTAPRKIWRKRRSVPGAPTSCSAGGLWSSSRSSTRSPAAGGCRSSGSPASPGGRQASPGSRLGRSAGSGSPVGTSGRPSPTGQRPSRRWPEATGGRRPTPSGRSAGATTAPSCSRSWTRRTRSSKRSRSPVRSARSRSHVARPSGCARADTGCRRGRER